jgi:drug/metabolite transporter (DMT)-like permease
MIAALLALSGALVYGAADFLGGVAASRLRSILVTAVAAASGLVILFAVYPVFGGAWLPTDVAWGALSGVIGVASIALLYACLAIGPMSILSPITAIVSAIAPMAWGLLAGESLSALGYAGLGVALVAVVLIAFIPGAAVVRPSARGLAMAIGAGLAIGAFLIVIDQTTPESGLVPLILNRGVNAALTGTIVLVLVLRAVRRGAPGSTALAARGLPVGATPTGHADVEHAVMPATTAAPGIRIAWTLAIACGVVDATANILLLLALRGGDLSIVSALTALYPAGTVLLAAVVLRERIAPLQWAGLVLALAAGTMLAVN